MGSRVLIQLALLIIVPSLVAPLEMENANTTIQPAFNPISNVSLESLSTWDIFAKGILKNLNQLLIELEINAFWYKDFIVFDYFEFVY
jgi:hypothetical protein